ncbi:unnamed protein product [Eruca vesicaria subsp. sativa]|uniref:Ubiquitin carboxyl-terminal hydrolase n=1 Tax=Eruca vesicaria subsp. sativa TaxID=29727 RepID=A0ABC8LUP2_ERUVS|nr:unnamed protein product [Eruca vesicaria subsp. sativa]
MPIPYRKSKNSVTRFRFPEEEKRIVSQLTTTSSNDRESSYFLISKTWYTSWERYVEQPSGGGGGAAPRPGPIDNNDIIDTRRLLVEDEDYILVPQRVWNTLLEWYSGGPPIPRTVIYLFLYDARDNDVTEIRVAKQATTGELFNKVCATKGVSHEKARIWDYFNMTKGKRLYPSSNKSLEELGIHAEEDILLEVDGSSEVNDELPLEEEPSGSGVSLSSSTSPGKGLAGLVNMGNTCYMNSALQCLAHTPPILEHFLRDHSKDELAKAFGELLKELWSSGRNAVEPRVFKTKLDKVAPQFSGHNQHDSHELLMSLLVRLHEVSDIVNVCQGQCKSSLVCPVCGKAGSTYESFTCLSLPLPSTLNRTISVTVFYGEGGHLPIRYTVTVPRSGSCSDLIAALSTACSLTDDESLLLAMVYENKIFGYLEDPIESLSVMKDDVHIAAYRMKNQMQKEAGKAKLEMLHGGQGKRPSLSGEKTRQEEVITLYACLEKYLAEEPLELDNMWSCPECKEQRQANKKYDMWKLPDILMFQLIRFKSSKCFTKKIDTFVDFPVEDLLELSKYVNNGKRESYLYELYAVINHLGGIGGVGHYTTYAKLVDDGNKWYHYDDSVVKPVNESEIKSAAAYVLCYRRVESESAEDVSRTDDMDQS